MKEKICPRMVAGATQLDCSSSEAIEGSFLKMRLKKCVS